MRETLNGRFGQRDAEAIATRMARASLRHSLDHTPLRELHGMEV